MLGERLRAARHARFVGRTAEKELFQSALNAAELPFAILHIFGPGGIGKTTLLQEFGLICQQFDIPFVYLDVRNVDPTPESFGDALRRTIGLQPNELFVDAIGQHQRYVILIDTYETLTPLDSWLREVFLPQMPENTLIVLAGRDALNPAWRADQGWQTLMRSLSLRNLDPQESKDYLARRQVPIQQHPNVLSFTYGHPLALSLVADVFAQRQDTQFQLEAVPDVVKTLLGQFVQKVPGPAHRAALEACALVRLTTQSLLAEMLMINDAHELFDWLHSLSFIETAQEGFFPHDLAREALIADLRWRNPEWYMELHRRARKHYMARLQQTVGSIQQRVLMDYIYLHRDNPLVRPLFEWKLGNSLSTDTMQEPGDMAALLDMVQRHEGVEAARLASYWFSRQPDGVLVFRDESRQPVGFLCMIAVHQTHLDDAQIDPAVRITRGFLQNQAPLRAGEVATLFRFWMARDTYQDVSPVQSLIFVNMVRHYLSTPGLAYTLLPCAQPDFWEQGFAYADLTRLPQVDFTVGERRYGVYGHDWRAVPPLSWLDLLGEREIGTHVETAPPAPIEQVVVLSALEFGAAVQMALRDYPRPDLLRSNPLLRSRLVMEKVGMYAGEPERVTALRVLLKEAADSLQLSPREAKFYRPLYHTYFQPAPTQEQAAELLDLPFSSFRRHLKSGIIRVTEILWAQEIGGVEIEQKLNSV